VIGAAFPGVIEACGDALSGALMNAGPIIHPPLIVMNAGPIEHFERWDIHKEGTQTSIAGLPTRSMPNASPVREGLGYGAPHFAARPIITQAKASNDVWPRLTLIA
jgi:opine dehydrogenase